MESIFCGTWPRLCLKNERIRKKIAGEKRKLFFPPQLCPTFPHFNHKHEKHQQNNWIDLKLEINWKRKWRKERNERKKNQTNRRRKEIEWKNDSKENKTIFTGRVRVKSSMNDMFSKRWKFSSHYRSLNECQLRFDEHSWSSYANLHNHEMKTTRFSISVPVEKWKLFSRLFHF